MDVGLVCDSCSSFNRMGAKTCSSCGDHLSLDGIKANASPFDETETRPGIPLTEPSYVPCPDCGQDVVTGHRFCGHCGARMDGKAAMAAMAAAAGSGRATTGNPAGTTRGGRSTRFFGAMQAARAKLVVIKGDGLDGMSFTLAGDEHQAGRADTPILFEDDTFISPVHANFYYDQGKLVVRDEESTNGVYIRIRGRVEVPVGARFLVGEQVLELQGRPPRLGPEAMEDGTYFFASPPQPVLFRIVQAILGGATGMTYQAGRPAVSIGREGNDINFPDDPFISGRHAQLSHKDGAFFLEDLDSKNGTFLRIDGEYTLEHGDYVFMGQQLLRVEIV